MPVIRQVRDQVYGLGASYHPDWDATRLIFFFISDEGLRYFCWHRTSFFEIGRSFHFAMGRRFSFVLKWSSILFWVIKRFFFFVDIRQRFFLILDEVFFWCRTKLLFDRTKFDTGQRFCLISDQVNLFFDIGPSFGLILHEDSLFFWDRTKVCFCIPDELDIDESDVGRVRYQTN